MLNLPMFTINRYDSYGDIIEKEIFLCYNNITFKVGTTIEDLEEYIQRLIEIKEEIVINYSYLKEEK